MTTVYRNQSVQHQQTKQQQTVSHYVTELFHKTNNYFLTISITGNHFYTASQKTAPFTFEHNFRKYGPILSILSLLQTEIICPNSPDLNPLDYEIWTVMQRLVYQRQSIMRMN